MKTTEKIYQCNMSAFIYVFMWGLMAGFVLGMLLSIMSCAPIPVEYNDMYQQGALYEQVNDSTWIKL